MIALLLILLGVSASAYRLPVRSGRVFSIRTIPLELEGKLSESRKWPVKFLFKDEEKVFEVPESMSLLEFGEKVFDGVESSCRNGICITCAARVEEGRENVTLAVSGLANSQLDLGFICSCQAFVTGPGVTVRLGQYDECYELQVMLDAVSYISSYPCSTGSTRSPT